MSYLIEPAAAPGLLGSSLIARPELGGAGGILLGTPESSVLIRGLSLAAELPALGGDGYLVQRLELDGQSTLVVAGNTETGVLYGTFALLRHLQTYKGLNGSNAVEQYFEPVRQSFASREPVLHTGHANGGRYSPTLVASAGRGGPPTFRGNFVIS